LTTAVFTAPPEDLAARLRAFDATVVTADAGKKDLAQMLSRDIRARRDAANQRETMAWEAVRTREDWERFRDVRIQALRASLGYYPPVPKDLKVRVTRTLEGDGYRIENVVFQGLHGVSVTANLYLPAQARASMPGILICHSHHNP